MSDITLPGALSAAMHASSQNASIVDLALGYDQYEGADTYDSTVDTGDLSSDPGKAQAQQAYAQTIYAAMMTELSKPLAQRVYESSLPRHDAGGHTMGIVKENGTGFTIDTDSNMQLGGEGANVMLLPADKIIAMWSSHIQFHGHVSIMSGQSDRVLDINTGPINAQMLPPVTGPIVPGTGTYTAPIALVTVPVQILGETNSVMPDVQCSELILPSDSISMVADAVRVNSEIAAQIASASAQNITSGKIPSIPDVRPATPNIGVYVIIPDHTHTCPPPIMSTGPVEIWGGINNIATQVHGLSYQYLFGYNRLTNQLDQSIADFVTSGGV